MSIAIGVATGAGTAWVTVQCRVPVGEASFKPRLGVPREIRAAFIPPAIAAFAGFAVGGYYAGLMPGVVTEDLGLSSLLVAGGIVAELYGVGARAVMATRRSSSRTAMLWGLALLLPGIGGMLLAKDMASIAVLAASSAVGGIGFGLCWWAWACCRRSRAMRRRSSRSRRW